jgi:hypothetical protein
VEPQPYEVASREKSNNQIEDGGGDRGKMQMQRNVWGGIIHVIWGGDYSDLKSCKNKLG